MHERILIFIDTHKSNELTLFNDFKSTTDPHPWIRLLHSIAKKIYHAQGYLYMLSIP